MKNLIKLVLLMLLLSGGQWVNAKVAVRDADGHRVVLSKPASRLVVLAPSAVETVYAIGAGGKILATVEYANYPEDAKKLPRVGNAFGLSIDAIVRYKPDLVVAWGSQSRSKEIQRLRELGYAIYVSNPVKLGEVADEMEELGMLTGLSKSAKIAAKRYRSDLAKLRQQFSSLEPVSVFMQINETPLYTVSDNSFLGQAITVCGGRNIFGTSPLPAPQISIEAVVRGTPQAIFSTFGGREQLMSKWLKWSTIPAVSNQTFYVLPDDTIVRSGPRLTDGVADLCRMLNDARKKLSVKH